MKSIDFPKANIQLAKDQPQYQTLFVFMDKAGEDRSFPVTCCLQLSEEELQEMNRTKKVWLTQMTFGNGYSPISMSLSSPFTKEESESDFTDPADENRTPAETWDKTHYKGTEGTVFPGRGYIIHGSCANCKKEEHEHYWSTRQCNL